MPESAAIRAHCLQEGWVQGTVLRRDDVAAVCAAAVDLLPDPPVSEHDRLMVLTQDCDMVHGRLADEPWVEVVPIRPVFDFKKNRDNPCLHGRNPRRLVFKIPGEEPEWWVMEAWNRFRFPRQNLLGRTPDPDRSLFTPQRKDLARWVSRRYTRAAFADEFNRRLATQKVELEDLWKSDLARVISGIFIQGADEERDACRPYPIKVLLAISSEAQDLPEMYDQAQEVGDRFKEILEACPGIVVRDLRVDPEIDITVADLRAFSRMDKDYRSPGDTPMASLPPEGVD